jgi:NAD+ kinase
MNRYSEKNFIKNLNNTNQITINPLSMWVMNKNNKIKKSIAVNEISVLRQSRQAANLVIKNGNKIITKKLISDGVLVSTPAGRTAYNLSVHGPILNLNSKKIAITPISPFRPRRWKGNIVSDKSKIFIKNIDHIKRPINAVADNFEVKNAKIIKIQINKKIKFNLIYNKNNSLDKKIKIEQIRKETRIN